MLEETQSELGVFTIANILATFHEIGYSVRYYEFGWRETKKQLTD
jgi:hypothetical protein